MTASGLLREAVASARSSVVVSVLTVLMVASMILVVMLTTGRTVGAEENVLGSIDEAGTRSIMIRAEQGSGVDTEVMDRIGAIDGIEWAGAFSAAEDVTNANVPGGVRVPMRYVYTDQADALGFARTRAEPAAYGSDVALEELGMPDSVGAIVRDSGETATVAGRIHTPDFLATFEPLLLMPGHMDGRAPVSAIVVVAERPELVVPVSDAVLSVLGADDPTKVAVSTSEQLAQLRATIEGQLGSFSRSLVLGLLAVTGALLAVILFGLVILRRKDFGRRRALGATRGFIIGLLLAQTGILAAIGIVIGGAAAAAVLVITEDPFPGIEFIGGLTVLTFLTALIAAAIPATVASRREPIRELRVP